MRIRSIKPEFWRSDDITSLDPLDRLLFVGLWSYVDDNGVGRDDLAHVLGDLFSRDWLANPQETVERVSGGLRRLQTAGLIARYEADGKPLLYVTGWSRHQRVEKPAKPRFPTPDPHQDADRRSIQEPSGESPEILPPGTGERGAEEQGNRGTGETAPRKRGTRLPDPFLVTRDMRQWAATEVPAVDVDRATRMFVDHFRAATGRTAAKQDWTAAWRNWLRRDAPTTPRQGQRESSLDRRDRQRDQMFADLAQLDPTLKEIGA